MLIKFCEVWENQNILHSFSEFCIWLEEINFGVRSQLFTFPEVSISQPFYTLQVDIYLCEYTSFHLSKVSIFQYKCVHISTILSLVCKYLVNTWSRAYRSLISRFSTIQKLVVWGFKSLPIFQYWLTVRLNSIYPSRLRCPKLQKFREKTYFRK